MRKLLEIFIVVAVVTFIFTGCTPPNYQLSTSITPAGSGTVSPASGTFKGGNNATLVASPAQYYKFAGWAGEASGTTNPLTVKMDSNKNIVASFTKIQYNLQMQIVPPDGGTINSNNGIYDAGTQIALIATPNNGYRFDHWSGDLTGTSNKSSITINKDQGVSAYFTKVYNLNITIPPNFGGTVNPGNGTYDAGSTVTLTAATTTFPNAFDHWIGTNNDNANPTTVIMSTDKAVTAGFKTLTAGTPVTKKAPIGLPSGGTITSLSLNSGQWVQGHITGDLSIGVRIVDASNNEVVGLGWTQDSQFTFQAKATGPYAVVIYGVNMAPYDNRYTYNYTLTYSTYQ